MLFVFSCLLAFGALGKLFPSAGFLPAGFGVTLETELGNEGLPFGVSVSDAGTSGPFGPLLASAGVGPLLASAGASFPLGFPFPVGPLLASVVAGLLLGFVSVGFVAF